MEFVEDHSHNNHEHSHEHEHDHSHNATSHLQSHATQNPVLNHNHSHEVRESYDIELSLSSCLSSLLFD
jgi:hypothetical protein